MHMEYQNNWVVINNYRECIDSEAKSTASIFSSRNFNSFKHSILLLWTTIRAGFDTCSRRSWSVELIIDFI